MSHVTCHPLWNGDGKMECKADGTWTDPPTCVQTGATCGALDCDLQTADTHTNTITAHRSTIGVIRFTDLV